ncbi:hypothetical protein [Polyangium sp. 6x1]|uniref:hypothetical protein n=1 Tax=Polyangium sp. 6x1 TaxID=3042689 RepID=UPI002482F143|nr:hypothetical protein [Polyangium sp. 6x1]MDI1442432.1 hypothetical protein [Polyangium sp. 6x1]
MFRNVILLLILSVASSGCGWLHAAQIAKRTNPKYREGKTSVPRPTHLALPFECPHERRGVERARSTRTQLMTNVMPELWRTAGGSGAPSSGTTSEALCSELYTSDRELEWQGTPAVRAAVQSMLPDEEQSLLVTLYAVKYECREVAGTVRDRNGVAVGSVGTGEQVCEETSLVDVTTALYTRDGELIWLSGREIDVGEDPREIASSIFEGYPREQIHIAGN